MNYKQIYDNFIQNRVTLLPEAYETHHIIPKSLGGSDETTNLIKLSHRDHFFAHKLLARFAGPEMKIALTWFINGSNVVRCGRIPSSREINIIRKQANAERSKSLTGRVFTEEHKANLSTARIGIKPWNAGLTVDDPRVKHNIDALKKSKKENPRDPWNKNLTGEEYKKYYSSGLQPPSMVGRMWINNGSEQRKIPQTDPIPTGWYRGRCDNTGENNPSRKK